MRTEAGEVGSLAADGADTIVRADKQGPAYPAARGPDILLYAGGARHMGKYLIAGWKSEEEINAKDNCPGSGHWHGRLSAVNPIRDPGWTCLEYMRTGRSKEDIVMRVMFDTIREETIILHSVAVKLGLRASRGPAWLTHRGEDPRYRRLQVRGASSGLEGPRRVDQSQGREPHNAVGAERRTVER